jgi:hypothetical protein
MAINLANNSSLANITALPASITGGAMTLISEQTASSSATIDFTSGIDSTYDSYVFKFINIHPATDDQTLQFNMSSDGGSNYNVTKTTTFFRAYHGEGGGGGVLEYRTANDLAQATGFQDLTTGSSNSNDACINSELKIFSPSSTTFVKHFIARTIDLATGEYAMDMYAAGYGNTTSAVDAIQFKMSSGNIDSGVIKLYGIS